MSNFMKHYLDGIENDLGSDKIHQLERTVVRNQKLRAAARKAMITKVFKLMRKLFNHFTFGVYHLS